MAQKIKAEGSSMLGETPNRMMQFGAQAAKRPLGCNMHLEIGQLCEQSTQSYGWGTSVEGRVWSDPYCTCRRHGNLKSHGTKHHPLFPLLFPAKPSFPRLHSGLRSSPPGRPPRFPRLALGVLIKNPSSTPLWGDFMNHPVTGGLFILLPSSLSLAVS